MPARKIAAMSGVPQAAHFQDSPLNFEVPNRRLNALNMALRSYPANRLTARNKFLLLFPIVGHTFITFDSST